MRDNKIDIMKGIGIILVVYGHACSNSGIVHLFHMPLFFIISGYCFKDEYGESVRGVVTLFKKRILSLYLPYVGYNLFYLVIHNGLCAWNIYTTNPDFTGSYGFIAPLTWMDFARQFILIIGFTGGEQLNGACWFLRVLFLLNMLTAVCDLFIHQLTQNEKTIKIMRVVTSVLFLILGYWFCRQGNLLVLQLPVVFSMYIFFYLGRVFKKRALQTEKTQVGKPNILMIISILGLAILYGSDYVVDISVGSNQYSDPVSLVILGVVGYGVVYCIVSLIQRFSFNGILAMIGKHTITIMSLHFLAFKCITYIIVKIRKEPVYMLAAFPHHPNAGLWWIAYMIVGIILPIAVDLFILDRLKQGA